MGILKKFEAGDAKASGQSANPSAPGVPPATRAAALNTSQMHAQGSIGDEAPGFGKVTKGFIATNQEEATNLNFKQSGPYSELDLDGKKPQGGTYRENAPEGASF